MFISGEDTGEKREIWDKIFCWELSLVHFTPKDWSFAYFSFLSVVKLILAGLSNPGVADTAKKFISGIVDTSDKF